MLFPSVEFIFLFLPIALAMMVALRHVPSAGMAALSISFCCFAGWSAAAVLLVSVAFNYAVTRSSHAWIFWVGIAGNVTLMVAAKATLPGWIAEALLAPGISFYTFKQIAYLVDLRRGVEPRSSAGEYLTFVTFFPTLLAGPIVRFREFSWQSIAVRPQGVGIGLTIFAIGLFKKVIIADNLAPMAGAAFGLTDSGRAILLLDAWIGLIAFSLQIYFDFSAYSDMATGVARMFGIRLPENFRSPYKASSIIEFWRRWHITLSRFLRDYVYITLGGNRAGESRRYAHLMVTMLIGGLWHGLGWTFLLWGALHGLYLVANHSAHRMGIKLAAPAGWSLTILVVILAWVPFRAATMDGTVTMYASLAGLGFDNPLPWTLDQFALLCAAGVIALLAPNTQQIMRLSRPVACRVVGAAPMQWRPTPPWAVVAAGIFVVAVLNLSTVTEFIYFKF